MKKLFPPGVAGIVLFAMLSHSCTHDSDTGPTTVRKWNVTLKAINEVPAVPNRNEEGDAIIELLSDNTLKYNIHIHNLSSTDALTNAHIHTGDAGTSGPVYIPFNPTFVGPGTTGVVTGLRQGQVDTLMNKPVYVNVHSNQVPGGLARAQLDKEVVFAMDVPLAGGNEVPPVTTTATGLAILRLTGDKVLYSKVTVNNLETNDTLTVSHIHPGATGTNGSPLIFLCNSVTDFGVLKISNPLDDASFDQLKNASMYVNAHSRKHGAGLIRGQIR
ncbi:MULTISPECIES: CHRD domain-containing protein [Niastella]|uniref:CHRD domain-containing protein n=1 Tax=Niastella soli TaxID=2821487 RepID=A0ABS3YXW4_9BACT|nr:CHRD domain-containing protein [Niastella soli]MBO9202748.1 CHRD domain-containing protein [Niastella soli]